MSRSAVYRRISAFRKVLSEHPDVYRFPGMTIDLYAVIHETTSDTPDP